MRYFLGIDQGSQSSRAVLFNGNGEAIEEVAEKTALHRPGEGRAEYDAEQIRLSVERLLADLLKRVDRNTKISACGIATQRSTVLAWDLNGAALSPALSWQDVRAQGLIAELRHHEQAIRRLTGLPLTPYYSASKMNWLLRHSDSVKQCSRDQLRLSPLVSYLLFHLLDTKPYVIDYSNAQRTQLLELDNLAWSDRLCNWFDIDMNCLPACKPMCTDYGNLATFGIPVKAVCGDQNAAMFGIGRLAPGVALVNIGTGAFILRELDRYAQSQDQLTGIAYADRRTVSFMREATVNGAGNALNWAEQSWGIGNLVARLPVWLQRVTEPPVFINAIGGLGTPWLRGDINSAFVVRGDYTDAEKAVAVIESIVFLIMINLAIMAEEAPLQLLTVTGGLARLDALCQKLSDLSGYVVTRTEVAEASARGVAWLAAGRPAGWRIEEAGDAAGKRFLPGRDQALERRYRIFKESLQGRLASDRCSGPER